MTGDFGKRVRGGTNLIIHELPESTEEEQLWSHFSSVGEVDTVRVIRDKDTGHSLRYGFVNYINPCDAARAIETLNGRKLQSKTIKVSYARPAAFSHGRRQGGTAEEEGASVPCILVYNLGRDSQREDVRRLFGRFGAVSDVTVITDFRTNKCRGLAFVTMANYEEAADAVAKLNGHRAGDNILRVFF